MRLLRAVAIMTLGLGGLAGCEDHNPTVVFPDDASISRKPDVEPSLDSENTVDVPLVAIDVSKADADIVALDAARESDVRRDGSRRLDQGGEQGLGARAAFDASKGADR